MWRCNHRLKQANLSFKEKHPARTYNLTTNHRREILYMTSGHPSRWNDKTLAYFDDFLSGEKSGKMRSDVQFVLMLWKDVVIGDEIEETKYRGAWGLMDNGYHRWSCTEAPANVNLLLTQQNLLEWIESFRKDTECTFRILKGRFHILKTGVRLQRPKVVDRIWLTSCALHNILLHVDGNANEWMGEIGCNDIDEMWHALHFALKRLSNDEICIFGSREDESMNSVSGDKEEFDINENCEPVRVFNPMTFVVGW